MGIGRYDADVAGELSQDSPTTIRRFYPECPEEKKPASFLLDEQSGRKIDAALRSIYNGSSSKKIVVLNDWLMNTDHARHNI